MSNNNKNNSSEKHKIVQDSLANLIQSKPSGKAPGASSIEEFTNSLDKLVMAKPDTQSGKPKK